MKNESPITTVVFEDEGQEYTEIDIEDGHIIAVSTPKLQRASYMIGRKIIRCRVGEKLYTRDKHPRIFVNGATVKAIYRNNHAPLFIPLKAKYFAAFFRGDKDTEYRPRNNRWNATTCWIGRPVVLSRGYGNLHRLAGEIVGFSYDTAPSKIPGWVECYGAKGGDASCIKIKIQFED